MDRLQTHHSLAAKGSFQITNSSITELSLFLSRETSLLLHLKVSGTGMQQLYTQTTKWLS